MLITEISQVSTNHRARVRPCSSVTTRVIQKRNVVIFTESPCTYMYVLYIQCARALRVCVCVIFLFYLFVSV